MEKQLPWYQILKRERKLRGLTQASVATALQCDTKTVGRWEQGKAFPSPYYVQMLIQLFHKDDASQLGLTGDELVVDVSPPLDLLDPLIMHTSDAITLPIPVQDRVRQEDWSDIPQMLHCYGRENELAEAGSWIIAEHCRVIAIVGMGGTGKTTFVKKLAERVKTSFDSIVWYSLQNTPRLEIILANFLRFLAEETSLEQTHATVDARISELMSVLKKRRCLLILDNAESLLQIGQHDGTYLEGYEGYGKLFHALGEIEHQSCLLLTSREKPKEIAYHEGNASLVRSFLLPGMKQAGVQQLLKDKDLRGSDEAWTTLIGLYAGNPLALQLVAVSIQELFGGDIAAFLAEEEIMFGDIQSVLAQHIQRLSHKEQRIMTWLAIEREPVALSVLYEDNAQMLSKASLFDVLKSLRRRALVETTADHRFALQPVVLKYITELFVEEMYACIVTGQTLPFASYAFIKAQVSDHIRESQIRLLLTPILENLLAAFGSGGCAQKLKDFLVQFQRVQVRDAEYAAGNLLNLLIRSGANLRGLDCSHLTINQAYLQDAELPSVNFTHSTFANCVFADTFTWILCVVVSPIGDVLAVGTTTGEVRVLSVKDGALLFTGRGHTDEIRAIAFSPDGELLASGSEDHTVRLWDLRTESCRYVLSGHTDMIRSVAFCGDGELLASGSEDCTVRLWERNTGKQVCILEGHTERVRAVACHPQSSLMASGGDDRVIRLWDSTTSELIALLPGHTDSVRALAFSADGRSLASGGEDQTVRIWEIPTGKAIAVINGHRSRVRTVAFGSDGRLASGSDDGKICLWDASSGQLITTLQGHSNRVWSLAFAPGSALLISASEDDMLRWWEIPSGRCLRMLRGYTDLIKSVAFHPDGHIIASGSEDRTVRLWERETGRSLKVLRGHANRIRAIAYHPQGTIVASGSEDETIRLWDTNTGKCLHILRGHTHMVRAVDFNATGNQLVSGSHDGTLRIWNVVTGQLVKVLSGHVGYVWTALFHPTEKIVASGGDDAVIHIWNAETGAPIHVLRGHTGRIWSLAFGAQGRLLASCSDDLTICIWDVQTGRCLQKLGGHTSWVRSVAFSPDGTTLASSSHDLTIRLWDVETGICTGVLAGHNGWIWSLAFDKEGKYLLSGADDSTMKLWDVARRICIRTYMRERPYEGMNITGTQGLTEGQKVALRFLGAVDTTE